jgi:hypothetical protein
MGPIGAVLRVRGLYVSEEDYEALRESIDTCVWLCGCLLMLWLLPDVWLAVDVWLVCGCWRWAVDWRWNGPDWSCIEGAGMLRTMWR